MHTGTMEVQPKGVSWKVKFLIQGIIGTAASIAIACALFTVQFFPHWMSIAMFLVMLLQVPLGIYGLFRYALIKHDEFRAENGSK